VFVDELELGLIGSQGADPQATARPACHPPNLPKVKKYGYPSRVQSSRGLERDTQDYVNLMWLMGCLLLDHKTIADFREDKRAAIRALCGQFVALCQRLKLFTQGR